MFIHLPLPPKSIGQTKVWTYVHKTVCRSYMTYGLLASELCLNLSNKLEVSGMHILVLPLLMAMALGL